MNPSDDSGPTHWAVLIGVGVNIITTYRDEECSRTDRSLRGADQEIVAAAEYLRTGPTPTDVVMLRVARFPYDDDSGGLSTVIYTCERTSVRAWFVLVISLTNSSTPSSFYYI